MFLISLPESDVDSNQMLVYFAITSLHVGYLDSSAYSRSVMKGAVSQLTIFKLLKENNSVAPTLSRPKYNNTLFRKMKVEARVPPPIIY